MKRKITYKTSGVDVDKANVFIKSIIPLMRNTMDNCVLQKRGVVGALFDLDKENYKNPVLVSSTDGVGTKLLVAKTINKHDTVGIDLVAMNVNDILCVGAKPLFFLDYIACGHLNQGVLKSVICGIVRGCKEAGCCLIGGETAEMPGMYKKDDYDLAGFAVGIVEKGRIIDGSAIKQGDRVIGLASSGLHSNGFSLVRKIFSSNEQKKLGQNLLKPTRIYVNEILKLNKKFQVKGIAHITGGAFYDKLTKILPAGKCFVIDKKKWRVPKIFAIIQEKGKIDDREMFRTFNMGIGMVVVIRKKDVSAVLSFLCRQGVKSFEIGEIINDNKRKIILVQR